MAACTMEGTGLLPPGITEGLEMVRIAADLSRGARNKFYKLYERSNLLARMQREITARSEQIKALVIKKSAVELELQRLRMRRDDEVRNASPQLNLQSTLDVYKEIAAYEDMTVRIEQAMTELWAEQKKAVLERTQLDGTPLE